MLHPTHVLCSDDVLASSCRDENVSLVEDPLDGVYLVALHNSLQRADRIDLGHDDSGSLTA